MASRLSDTLMLADGLPLGVGVALAGAAAEGEAVPVVDALSSPHAASASTELTRPVTTRALPKERTGERYRGGPRTPGRRFGPRAENPGRRAQSERPVGAPSRSAQSERPAPSRSTQRLGHHLVFGPTVLTGVRGHVLELRSHLQHDPVAVADLDPHPSARQR